MRHQGPDGERVGDWVPVVMSQIPAVEARDLRISNGVIRCTFNGSDNAVDAATDGDIVLDAVDPATGLWVHVATFQLSRTTPFRPVGTPMIVKNSPDSVAVKFACDTSSNSPSQYLSVGLDRGQTFVRFSGTVTTTYLRAVDDPARTTITGGIKSDAATPEGFGWVFAHDETFDDSVDGPVGRWSIGTGTTTPLQWALGVYNDFSFTRAEPDEVVSQWWLATGTTQRFVAL